MLVYSLLKHIYVKNRALKKPLSFCQGLRCMLNIAFNHTQQEPLLPLQKK